MPQTEEGEESLKEKVSGHRGHRGQSTVLCAVQGIRKCPQILSVPLVLEMARLTEGTQATQGLCFTGEDNAADF